MALGWIIEFHLGSSLFGKNVKLFTNHPESAEKEFERKTYQQLQWISSYVDVSKKSPCYEETGIFATLHVCRAGSYHYYFISGATYVFTLPFTVPEL